MAFDRKGNLWVGARWPFWGEVGLAMLSARELPYRALPGGGFDTGQWHVCGRASSIPSLRRT